MWCFIVIALICCFVFGDHGPCPPHCSCRCGGFFFPRRCGHCAEGAGSGCLTWIIIGIILFAILS